MNLFPLASLLSTAFIFLATLSSLPNIKAETTKATTVLWLEINGKNFGEFRGISKMSDINIKVNARRSYKEIDFSREFVASPSLASWAKKAIIQNSSKSEIRLIFKSSSNDKDSVYLLKSCSPIAWTLESNESGGFKEKIKIAVKDISIQ